MPNILLIAIDLPWPVLLATVSEFAPGATTPTATLTGLDEPCALAFDASGNLYVANEGNDGTYGVSKFAPWATRPTATLTGLDGPSALAFDANGDLYVANDGNNTVSKFAPGATTPTAKLSGLGGPAALAFDASGDLYAANDTTGSEFSGASLKRTPAAGVVIRSSLPTRPMSIGGISNAVAGINLTDAELAQIQTGAGGTVTFGDSSQTGNITFTTATPATTPGASVAVVQSTTGPGQIILDDTGNGTGLDGNNGAVAFTPGSGEVLMPLNASGTPLTTQGFVAAGLTLNLSLSFAPTVGTQLTLISDTATPAAGNPIVGTFSNLPEDGTISATYDGTTYWFQANYDGGDGNDLVLTAMGPGATATTVFASQASVTYGTPVTFTATVTAPIASGPPTGSVDFYDATTGHDLGPGTLNGSTGMSSTWTLTTGARSFNVTAGDTIAATYTPGAGLGSSIGTTTETVTAKAITVTAAAATKTYDGTVASTGAPAITSGSLVAGDTAAFTETYTTAAVGDGKSLTPAGSVSDGNGGNNYAVTFVSSRSGAITGPGTTTLVWAGPGNVLSLTDGTSGGTPTIIISEPTAGVSTLEIYLGANYFASGSTASAAGLTYQNAGSPTTSVYATINISTADMVNLYVANQDGSTVSEFAPGATTPTATLTGVSYPDSLAFDPSGNFSWQQRDGTSDRDRHGAAGIAGVDRERGCQPRRTGERGGRSEGRGRRLAALRRVGGSCPRVTARCRRSVCGPGRCGGCGRVDDPGQHHGVCPVPRAHDAGRSHRVRASRSGSPPLGAWGFELAGRRELRTFLTAWVRQAEPALRATAPAHQERSKKRPQALAASAVWGWPEGPSHHVARQRASWNV
jgi:hypothetical protein